MAKISSYPFPSSVSLSDYVIGTISSSSKETKNFIISDIISLPGSETYVPYTDALYDVDLGTYSLSGYDISASNSLNTDGPFKTLGNTGVSGEILTSNGSSGAPSWRSNNYSYGVFAQTELGNPIVPSSGQDSLLGVGVGSLSVPANAFKVGDSFTVKVCGYLSCANNQDIHIRVKSNDSLIADAGIFRLSITTNKYFELNLDFTITKIGGLGVAQLFTNGQFSYNKNSNSNIDGTNFASIDSTMFDTTITNTLSITAEWVTSDSSNSIQSQNAVLTKVY